MSLAAILLSGFLVSAGTSDVLTTEMVRSFANSLPTEMEVSIGTATGVAKASFSAILRQPIKDQVEFSASGNSVSWSDSYLLVEESFLKLESKEMTLGCSRLHGFAKVGSENEISDVTISVYHYEDTRACEEENARIGRFNKNLVTFDYHFARSPAVNGVNIRHLYNYFYGVPETLATPSSQGR